MIDRHYHIIDTATGEVVGDKTLKEGQTFRVVDTNSTEAFKRKKDGELRLIDPYYHILYEYGKPLYPNLTPLERARLLLLGSYLTYGHKLFDDNRNKIKKSSLTKIWNTSNRAEINKTFNKLKNLGYIDIDEEGYIVLNEELMVKGSVEPPKSKTYTRIFGEKLQDVWEATPVRKRKQLGYLVALIPYLHYDTNILVKNPAERDTDKLEPLSWTEIAEICGIEAESKNINRFMRDLTSFKWNTKQIVAEFGTRSPRKYRVLVNPILTYAGSSLKEWEKVVKIFDTLK